MQPIVLFLLLYFILLYCCPPPFFTFADVSSGQPPLVQVPLSKHNPHHKSFFLSGRLKQLLMQRQGSQKIANTSHSQILQVITSPLLPFLSPLRFFLYTTSGVAAYPEDLNHYISHDSYLLVFLLFSHFECPHLSSILPFPNYPPTSPSPPSPPSPSYLNPLLQQSEVVVDVYYYSPARLERKSTSNVDELFADPPEWATVAWVNVDGMNQ